MAAPRSWMLMSRGLRGSKVLRNREENKDDIVKLDFNSDPPALMSEILNNVCKKHGISSVKKLNYLNAFVHLISKNPGWKSLDTFGFTFEEIVCCLRVALIQDSVQVRAVGLRALRYIVRNEENVLSLNKLHFPYLIARSLDLLLKTDNERVLMSERIQALKMMRHILSIAPQHFSPALVRPLVSVALRPVEETDRLLKACIATLCELCVLNSAVFIECDGVRALLRNAILIPSSHIVEAICGALLFLLNKPSGRDLAKVDLRILISGYTNSMVTEKNSFREEERRLTWTNFALLTVLRSCSGIFELCNNSSNGLKSIVHLLYLNKTNVIKAILELLYDLINIPQPDRIDDDRPITDVIETFTFRESFKISEGFVISEAEHFIPSLTKNRVNLIEVHTALVLLSLLEAGLPDALVEVIVSGEPTSSLNAALLLGEFLNLARQLLPTECYVIPPALPNLVSYAVRGCPLQLPSFNTSAADSDEQYSYNNKNNHFSHYSKEMFKISDGAVKSLNSGENSTRTLDLRLSYPNLNVPENCVTKSSHNEIIGTKDKAKSSTDISDQDFVEDFTSHNSAEVNPTNAEATNSLKLYSKSRFYDTSQDLEEIDESVLNERDIDLPPCKEKQRRALSAVGVLSSLQKKFENPPRPVSLLLNCVVQYGEPKENQIPVDEINNDKLSRKRTTKISFKELEELLKETGVLIVPDASRWKWEAIRILLRLSMNNVKMLNDSNFKNFLKKLIQFFKPSSKKYSHTLLKSESMGINIYTLVACDLLDILLDSKMNDGLKILSEFLDDLSTELGKLPEAKSVHDCILSPLRLTSTLSQDYFLLLGRLSNTDVGSLLLENSGMLQKLQHIACNINLDCYVKLIISCLSYVHGDNTRKLLSSVLSCSFASSRLYATKYLLVLLRIGVTKPRSFQHWVIEMLVNQLYDENQTIAMIALNVLNEAADDKDYLDSLVSLRPSLLHLGDTGLLLLIRFLSTEKGFAYLQAANFVVPQLQRWASSFNVKYVQIVEGELHDALSQYQRGDDGRYRKRVTGCAAKLKNVIVPPHLYGQLVQHAQGFELLLKQDCINSMVQTILIANYDSDEAVIELKAALWAMGHFSTSSMGAKYLHGYGVIRAIVSLTRTCSVYAVKMTAIYILSMIATSKEGVAVLNTTNWRCLKRSRHDNQRSSRSPFIGVSVDRLFDYEYGETVLSPSDLDSPESDSKLDTNSLNGGVMRKIMNKFKSATLPQRGVAYRHVQHNRSFSESKADVLDDWSSSGSPQSNFQSYISEIKSHILPKKYRSDSFGTDSSTSGVSSCDSVPGKPSTYSERLPTLSPIPSTSSLTTIMTNAHEKDHNHRSFLSKRHSSINFGVRLNTHHNLGYKTFRILQNRHQLSNFPQLSASAAIEYLSAPERRQMSPLVRPKFPRYFQKPSTPEFEIRSTPFQMNGNDSLNISSTIESSQFSHSTEIDEEQCEFEGPLYQGICLPLKMSYLLSGDSNSLRSSAYTTRPAAPTHKCNDEFDLSGDSDSERMKSDENRAFRAEHTKRRRHDKSACLLCSVKPNAVNDRNIIRSRRTSTSSIHRTRTETESSYGGGIGPENDSPILLTWQQKPVGLVDNTPGGASCSTLENSDSQSTSGMMNNDSSMKSRSIMRKEVLKIVEQLGNPVLYRTCKQGLLSLKQICGDLFQDICLFSDVSYMLGSINYRIQARQLIQDLFLDAPFHELYEEVNSIWNRTPAPQEAEDFKSMLPYVPTLLESSDSKSSQHGNPSTNLSKDSPSTNVEDHTMKTVNATAAALEVIIEADSISETSKTDRSDLANPVCDIQVTSTALPAQLSCSVAPTSEQRSVVQSRPVFASERSSKNLYDCRRAYSYPATDYIITGLGIHDTNGLTLPYMCPAATKITTARSRSVSATCSYISEVAMKKHFMLPPTPHQGMGELTTFSPLVFDGRLRNFAASFSKRSVLAFRDHSPSVMLTFENPYEVIDLDSQLLLRASDTDTNKVLFESDNLSPVRRDESQTQVSENDTIVSRHRTVAEFEPPDNTIVLEHSNPNV